MNLYCDYEEDEGFLPGGERGMEDSRLLDAAETLVTLQTSDLGSSNNPLFGTNLTVLQNSEPFRDDKRTYQILGDMQPSHFDSQTLEDDPLFLPNSSSSIGDQQEVVEKTEMLRVGPLFLKSSILEDILSERKQFMSTCTRN
ncbi:uncharacterized protein LOC111709180 isoform X2 [Eurytemora carolleeae]|uniref:uncharacterized protein LOC111709180 isoform X2 n=1 Tax=Eurytemora carolleeae TaxID=1294199 RepID=UPI000C785FC8|nr:uncharacterized protein LOC111709180 isoform X2 [Eurytemora carolleeae]|eukprot:XP_023338561.1 uncharacterized protein LOC111709180 isoform X2 [Eurytemora affinis]